MRVLDIPVSPALLKDWVDWLAPDKQPFYVTAKQLRASNLQQDDTEPDPNLRDTYRTYSLDSRLRSVWLDEAGFLSLPQATRAGLVRAQVVNGRDAVPSVRRWRGVLGPEIKAQADGHRFVWWKSLLQASRAAEVLPEIVSEDLHPSRHREVRSWPKLLPNARALAGTWPDGSGANCFGTVMAAAGVEGAEDSWMQREPFEQWLADHTSGGGRDDVPGTVFVWRDIQTRLVQHAAVTLGGGYMLHKPSQAWSTPRKVRTVSEVRRSTRTAGWHLERHSLG
ncbi:MAG: hypothetical protein QOH84_1382 [Kribbellaceae bacterium]|nr:hypothetical protein [Kribbellaceae bacterium]